MKMQFWQGTAALTATVPAAPNGKMAGAAFDAAHVVWALGSLCTLHQRSFSAEMLTREFPPLASDTGNSYPESTLLHAAQRLGFRVKRIRLAAKDCASLPLPLLVQVNPPPPPPQLLHMTLQIV